MTTLPQKLLEHPRRVARGLRGHPGVNPLLLITAIYFLSGLDRSLAQAFARRRDRLGRIRVPSWSSAPGRPAGANPMETPQRNNPSNYERICIRKLVTLVGELL